MGFELCGVRACCGRLACGLVGLVVAFGFTFARVCLLYSCPVGCLGFGLCFDLLLWGVFLRAGLLGLRCDCLLFGWFGLQLLVGCFVVWVGDGVGLVL